MGVATSPAGPTTCRAPTSASPPSAARLRRVGKALVAYGTRWAVHAVQLCGARCRTRMRGRHPPLTGKHITGPCRGAALRARWSYVVLDGGAALDKRKRVAAATVAGNGPLAGRGRSCTPRRHRAQPSEEEAFAFEQPIGMAVMASGRLEARARAFAEESARPTSNGSSALTIDPRTPVLVGADASAPAVRRSRRRRPRPRRRADDHGGGARRDSASRARRHCSHRRAWCSCSRGIGGATAIRVGSSPSSETGASSAVGDRRARRVAIDAVHARVAPSPAATSTLRSSWAARPSSATCAGTSPEPQWTTPCRAIDVSRLTRASSRPT